jgi:hypothetical protein
MPFYISSALNIFIKSCVLDRTGDTNSFNHHFYINSFVKNLTIDNIILIGGNGYAIDVKNDDGNANNAPMRVIISNITVVGCNSFVISETYSDVVMNNITGYIDPSLNSASGYWFGVAASGNIQCDNVNLSGGSNLIKGLNSGGSITINFGKIGQTTGVMSTGTIALLSILNVEFTDFISSGTDKIGFWNSSGYGATLAEFKNCKFIFLTAPTNDSIKAVANETRFYNCIFDIQTGTTRSYVIISGSPGICILTRCTYKGNITKAIHSSSTGTINQFECVFEPDNSVINGLAQFKRFYGAGSPEGVITAVVGSEYFRSDGGTGTSHYVKESGTGNTGWIGK